MAESFAQTELSRFAVRPRFRAVLRGRLILRISAVFGGLRRDERRADSPRDLRTCGTGTNVSGACAGGELTRTERESATRSRSGLNERAYGLLERIVKLLLL